MAYINRYRKSMCVCSRDCVRVSFRLRMYACATYTQQTPGENIETPSPPRRNFMYTYRAFSNPSAIVRWKFSAKFWASCHQIFSSIKEKFIKKNKNERKSIRIRLPRRKIQSYYRHPNNANKENGINDTQNRRLHSCEFSFERYFYSFASSDNLINNTYHQHQHISVALRDKSISIYIS